MRFIVTGKDETLLKHEEWIFLLVKTPVLSACKHSNPTSLVDSDPVAAEGGASPHPNLRTGRQVRSLDLLDARDRACQELGMRGLVW